MSIPIDVLYQDVERSLFTSHRGGPSDGPLVGAELELIPFWTDSGRRVPVSGAAGSTLSIVRPWADRHGWREHISAKGTPVFMLPDGGNITFEPGGQLEFSAAPSPSVSGLLRNLERVLLPLQDEAARHQVHFLAAGIDPVNPIENVDLQLDCVNQVAATMTCGLPETSTISGVDQEVISSRIVFQRVLPVAVSRATRNESPW